MSLTGYTQLTNLGPHSLREAFHDDPTSPYMTTVAAKRPLGEAGGTVSILWASDCAVMERNMCPMEARALAAELVASCDAIEAAT